MELRNCIKCGKIFGYRGVGPAICDNCKKEAEERFDKVKEYIRDNPLTSINEVAEECHVTVAQIKQWVREERLMFSKESGVVFHCENCGAPIRTGRFCEKCKSEMVNDLDGMYQKPQAPAAPPKRQRETDRMRFAGRK
ncbi:MAG: flagellar protein [Lachnospiraceae bacterium]|uniref:Flagellar protein n=1 Tax=Candidatus Weimeria bifida TaxID=2599074 RepID=A0A6N7J1G2_9FIRM|nr:flagellar protein [Candidatus Weimeria bifida]RRF96433.1 MAG: flagellar protein [Lachnospiraceae bacterium]